MKNSIFTLFSCLFLLSCYPSDAQRVSGKGSIVTQEFDLETFSAIGLSMAAKVTLTQGSQQKVVVHGQQNILDLLNKKIKGGSWEIRCQENVRSYESLRIEITMKELDRVAISGSGDVITTNTFRTNGDFDLAISGSGDADIKVEADDIDCSISGSGNAVLQGKARSLDISIAGSGDVKATDLAVNHCAISTAGSGDSEVSVSDELTASIVGSGDVYYKGDPKVKVSVIGSGNVHKNK